MRLACVANNLHQTRAPEFDQCGRCGRCALCLRTRSPDVSKRCTSILHETQFCMHHRHSRTKLCQGRRKIECCVLALGRRGPCTTPCAVMQTCRQNVSEPAFSASCGRCGKDPRHRGVHAHREITTDTWCERGRERGRERDRERKRERDRERERKREKK